MKHYFRGELEEPGLFNMKRITAILTITAILSLAIVGCSVSNGQAPSSATVSASLSASIETTAESTIASGTASEVTTSAFDPEVPGKFKEKLGAGYMYQDKFIPQQFLYISDEKIVIAVFLGGTEQIREIDRSKYSRMEITKTSDFAKVEIFDVSGSSLLITLSPAEADEIQSVLG